MEKLISLGTLTKFKELLEQNENVTVWQGGVQVSDIGVSDKDYTFKQGNRVIATLNISKGLVLPDAQVVIADGTELKGTDPKSESAHLTAGYKYIKITMHGGDSTNNILWISIKELIPAELTGSTGEHINIEISGREIKAILKLGSIKKADLTATLSQEITDNTNNIATLRGNSSVVGSVENLIDSEISIATKEQIDNLFI